VLGLLPVAYGADPKIKRYVNVGDIASMKQLSETDPITFAKAHALLCEIDFRSPRDVEEWAKAKFGANKLVHSGSMTASQPPKRSISFVLGETSFAGTYTPGQWGKCTS
jgi:hypothetical protein